MVALDSCRKEFEKDIKEVIYIALLSGE